MPGSAREPIAVIGLGLRTAGAATRTNSGGCCARDRTSCAKLPQTGGRSNACPTSAAGLLTESTSSTGGRLDSAT